MKPLTLVVALIAWAALLADWAEEPPCSKQRLLVKQYLRQKNEAMMMPGDIIVADAQGVVVVPRAEAEAVLAAAHRIQVQDKGQRRELSEKLKGRRILQSNRPWFASPPEFPTP
jgi:hypothetical protein